jgi:hypothetical protein
MKNADNSNQRSRPSPQSKNHIFDPWLRLVIGGGAFVVVALAVYTYCYSNMTDRFKFWADTSVQVLIFTAIVVQAIIYRRQWEIMQKQVEIANVALEPHLRITNIRVVNFEAGEHPVFVIWIINEGATDAVDIELSMRINLGEGDEAWSRPQIVTIPARQERHYWIRSATTPEQEHIDGFNDSVPVKVFGYFKFKGHEQKEFCYRYYPWKGKRPRDVGQFVPCDFNPGLEVTMHAKAGGFATVMGKGEALRAVIAKESKKAEPEPAEPKNAEDHVSKHGPPL